MSRTLTTPAATPWHELEMWHEPEMWPKTLAAGELRRIQQAWRTLPWGRQHFASRVADAAQRRIDELICVGAVWPDAQERLYREGQPWIALRNVGLALVDLPGLDRAFHTGRLSWAKVAQVARVAVLAHEDAWIERARALDVRSLARLVLHSPPGGPPVEGDEPVEGREPLEGNEALEKRSLGDAARGFGATKGTWRGIERELAGRELGASPSGRDASSAPKAARRGRVASLLRRVVAVLRERVRFQIGGGPTVSRPGPSPGTNVRALDAPNVRQTVRVGFSSA